MTTEEAANSEDQWPPAKSEDEWLLMYLRGLSIPQIARLCRVNHETVRHSIRQRETLTPSIVGQRLVLHDRPRYRPPTVGRDGVWNKHYAAVFRFVAGQGRFPKQLGGPRERGLQCWLYAQRLKLEAGDLKPRRQELLDRLGRWRTSDGGDWRTKDTYVVPPGGPRGTSAARRHGTHRVNLPVIPRPSNRCALWVLPLVSSDLYRAERTLSRR